MPLFWSLAALLVALTLAALLLPLLRKSRNAPAPDASEAAIAVYRDQKRALDAELASGAISTPERDLALADLARRVAEEPDAAVATDAPAPRRAWPVALALLVVVPSAAITLYTRLGHPPTSISGAGGGEHEASKSQIVAMVDNLAQRLKERPDDARGWILLAHSYQTLERFPEAAEAYERATALTKDDPNLLADYADALAMAQGGKLAGKPTALVQGALAIDSTHKKALALAATAELETRDFDASIAYWRRLAAQLPPGSDESRQVAEVIAEVETVKREGKAAAAPSARGSRAEDAPHKSGAIAGNAAAIAGRVDLSPALASRVALSDTVFIYARAVDGPRMPLAVLRIPAKELPTNFLLDDRMSMAPDAKLSGAAFVIVEARISKSGNAIAQPGDLFGRSAPVKPGTMGLAITIDQVVP